MKSLAVAKAKEKGTEAAIEEQQILKAEQQRRNARLIKAAHQQQRAKMVAVIGPSPDGGRQEYSTRESMGTVMLDELRKRFFQGSDTPFMQEPLLSIIGNTGTGDAAEEILQGSFDAPVNTSVHTVKLIEQLKRTRETWDFEIDVAEYRERWQKKNDHTAAGPSGLRFPHFKAGAQHDKIGAFEAVMTGLPFQFGFAPKRWREGAAIMIPKIEGNWNVEKLRIIILFEADFNFGNKEAGLKMVDAAERANGLAPEQYGGRRKAEVMPGMSAVMHALNKVLTYDAFRYQKREAALTSSDAKACYDRIVHAPAG